MAQRDDADPVVIEGDQFGRPRWAWPFVFTIWALTIGELIAGIVVWVQH